jgi:hypothetical protein
VFIYNVSISQMIINRLYCESIINANIYFSQYAKKSNRLDIFFLKHLLSNSVIKCLLRFIRLTMIQHEMHNCTFLFVRLVFFVPVQITTITYTFYKLLIKLT